MFIAVRTELAKSPHSLGHSPSPPHKHTRIHTYTTINSRRTKIEQIDDMWKSYYAYKYHRKKRKLLIVHVAADIAALCKITIHQPIRLLTSIQVSWNSTKTIILLNKYYRNCMIKILGDYVCTQFVQRILLKNVD